MDSDSLSPSPPRSEPDEVDIPHEQIRRTMTIVLNVFAVRPVHAYHPGRHIALKEAVPVLSALNRSHGLTEDQVEGLGRLLRDWDRIINDAVEASDAKKKAAAQQLSLCSEAALTLSAAQSKKQFLDEKIKMVDRYSSGKEYEALLVETANTVMEMEKAKQSVRDADLMAATLKKQIEKAEESMEKANQEWKALEMLLRGIHSSLALNLK